MNQGSADPYLLALVREYEFIGMLGLGKVADPSTGETQADLQKTQLAIGVLEMLERKTESALTQSEQQELRRVLTFLRLNFVEEAGKASQAEDPKAAGEPATEGEGAPKGETGTPESVEREPTEKPEEAPSPPGDDETKGKISE